MAKLDRTKNATRNIAFGIILKTFQIVCPFFMRTAMIYLMGVQYLGLNGLFTSVLQVLNLAELGVGTAMVYSMYKPIADDDEAQICALMKLYRTFYRAIGLIIAVLGGCLTPFIPQLIKSDVPSELNVYILYLMNLSVTVLSYWLFSYKNSILQAHQREDVVSRVALATSTIQYSLQLFVLWYFRNYYYYVMVTLATQVLTNIVTAYFANNIYPDYKPRGNVSKAAVRKIVRRISDLFTTKLGMVIYASADTIVISSFLGLTSLAIYQNYFFVMGAISGFMSVIFRACTAGIGNSIVVETKEKNFRDLNKFTFMICWAAGFCSVCLLCLYQPFMELWVGRDLMLDMLAVVCFVLYFFFRQMDSMLNLYKDASGMWHEDRFRPLISAGINLALNLLLIHFSGLYGVVLTTVLAMAFVSIPWLLHNLFTVIFDRKFMRGYVKRLGFYWVFVAIVCLLAYMLCSRINYSPVATLLIRAGICCLIPNVIFFLVYRKMDEYREALVLVDKMSKGKIHPILTKIGLK